MATAGLAMGGLGVGDVFAGKYRIERVLGQGGMGVVVGAHHLQLDELVAIKVLHPTFATQPEQVERFLREGRAAVKIRSEHVVRVSDIGTVPVASGEGGAPYMVMEFLEGMDLGDLVKRRGAQSVDDVVTWVLQACEALAEAHSLGIVHRDLKPANLFLTERPDGSPCVKVLDFGISKLLDGGIAAAALTNTNGMMGSPYYMSPEQLSSPRGVDARADVWALGVILFELLTGVRPYHAESLTALVLAIATEPPRSLGEVIDGLPKELEAVVERCLEKKPEQRFSDVGALAQALLPFAPPSMAPSVERIQRVLTAPRRSKTGATDRLPAVRDAGTSPQPAKDAASSASQSGPRRTVSPEQKALHAASLDDQQGATLLESSPPPDGGADGVTTGKGLGTTNEGVSASRPPPVATAPARGRALPWIAGAAVLGAGVVVLVAQLRGPSSPTPASAAASSPGVTATATPTAAASSGASAGAASPGATVTAPASASASTTVAAAASTVSAPSASNAPPTKPAPSGVVPAKASAAKAKGNCDPPYTLDADGQKHFKVECL